MECPDENTTESEVSFSGSNDLKRKDEGEMTKENTLYLISLVKSYGCLWNEKDPDFENEPTKTEAWQRISEAMGRSEGELKTKWETMHSCFVTCHAKNLSNIIKNKWFAYNALRFLESKIPHDEPRDEPEQKVEENNSDTNDVTVRGGMSEERSLCLINQIKSYKCLWDKNCPEYRNYANKIVAWNEISQTMGIPTHKIKMQWNNLRTMNRHYVGRMEKKWKNGSSSRKPNWFAFDAMRFINVTREFLPKWEKGLNEWPYSHSDETEDEDAPQPELVNVGNTGNDSVPIKSPEKPPMEKLTKVTPQIHTTPQNQPHIPNGIAQNPQTRTLRPVRVKRLVPSGSAQDPLRIVRQVPAQLGQPVTAATNQTSVKSFVNLLEHELNALSADYATMAQVEIYRIVGEFKLKDVTRRNAASAQLAKTRPVRQVQQVQQRTNKIQMVKITSGQQSTIRPKKIIPLNQHVPVVPKTERTNLQGNDDKLEVLMECEEA
ncbi:uncharacterized protein LOC131272512 isoform X1 [Anopheles coustani]|uniref:uncharacterized protein LOC131272512 isoform X1 n=1 Tax=Anopheles coustani TaxID=139045 RepID=UPI00265ADC33|nr:uncharacterized protein LOC131272512 isoform X1 [Anopheles coustani]XP_058130249.1 uncharacterized protein LOC131272512 isoform X1 [Anopheles coustani]